MSPLRIRVMKRALETAKLYGGGWCPFLVWGKVKGEPEIRNG